MVVDKKIALKLWADVYGNQKWAQDCFGVWMCRDDYGDTERTRNNRPGGTGSSFNYGWTVDHIMPISKFESEEEGTFWNNLEPMHYLNNEAKSDKTSFNINGVDYQVVKCKICSAHSKKGYGIQNRATGQRVDWKFTLNSYYI